MKYFQTSLCYHTTKTENKPRSPYSKYFSCVCLFEVLVCLRPLTRARLSSLGSQSCAGIWRCIKAGERDALQVLNWISCWISGTPLKCMWASPNDALIFELQRHSVSVCVLMFVCVSPSISTDRLVAHNRYVCIISGSNCFVRLCWWISSDSCTYYVYCVLYILWQGRVFILNTCYIQQTRCLLNKSNVCF